MYIKVLEQSEETDRFEDYNHYMYIPQDLELLGGEKRQELNPIKRSHLVGYEHGIKTAAALGWSPHVTFTSKLVLLRDNPEIGWDRMSCGEIETEVWGHSQGR